MNFLWLSLWIVFIQSSDVSGDLVMSRMQPWSLDIFTLPLSWFTLRFIWKCHWILFWDTELLCSFCWTFWFCYLWHTVSIKERKNFWFHISFTWFSLYIKINNNKLILGSLGLWLDHQRNGIFRRFSWSWRHHRV